jgi:hypothetical protein
MMNITNSTTLEGFALLGLYITLVDWHQCSVKTHVSKDLNHTAAEARNLTKYTSYEFL